MDVNELNFNNFDWQCIICVFVVNFFSLAEKNRYSNQSISHESGYGSGSNPDPGVYDYKLKKKILMKSFFDHKFQFTYVQATVEAVSPQREHPALQKRKFINLFLCLWQCAGSVTFWGGSGYGPGSADPCLWPMDPDSDPDPAIFVIDLQYASKKPNFSHNFAAYYFLKVHLHHLSKIKSQKESQNSRNQGFSYYFCMMIEGSGSRAGSGSIHLTCESGSGSRRPKKMWILWIRFRNTGLWVIFTLLDPDPYRTPLNPDPIWIRIRIHSTDSN